MRNAERGASMVEFAFAATLLLLLLFGIIEFGRVLYTYHTVSNAARIGSRWAMVRGSGCSVLDHCGATSADISAYVLSVVPMVDANTMTVTASWTTTTNPNDDCTATDPGGNNGTGHIVCVTVSYPFNFAVPMVSQNALTLSSTSRMAISQ
jgi:Flp pilus assembly protein TadG